MYVCTLYILCTPMYKNSKIVVNSYEYGGVNKRPSFKTIKRVSSGVVYGLRYC